MSTMVSVSILLILFATTFSSNFRSVTANHVPSLVVGEYDMLYVSPNLRVMDSPGVKPGNIVLCERVRIVGRSKLTDLEKLFHLMKLNVRFESSSLQRQNNIEFCLHRNESLAIGMCPQSNWEKFDKRHESRAVSPFGHHLLDIRVTAAYPETFELVIHEESYFFLHIFGALGAFGAVELKLWGVLMSCSFRLIFQTLSVLLKILAAAKFVEFFLFVMEWLLSEDSHKDHVSKRPRASVIIWPYERRPIKCSSIYTVEGSTGTHVFSTRVAAEWFSDHLQRHRQMEEKMALTRVFERLPRFKGMSIEENTAAFAKNASSHTQMTSSTLFPKVELGRRKQQEEKKTANFGKTVALKETAPCLFSYDDSSVFFQG